MERSPYRALLDDKNFRRWVSSVEEGSPNTASVYFRRVGNITSAMGKKPSDLAAMSRQEAKGFLQDVIEHLRTKGSMGTTIAGYVKGLKSWFDWNEVDTGRVRVSGASGSLLYENEVPPRRQELRRILDVAKIRGKALASMGAYGGSGPRCSGTPTGTTG